MPERKDYYTSTNLLNMVRTLQKVHQATEKILPDFVLNLCQEIKITAKM